MMLLYFLFLFLAHLHISRAFQPNNFEDRIVGGEDAKIEDYPFQVGIFRNKNFICGGTIISQKYILTAAHCILCDPKELLVYVGSTDHKDGHFLDVAEVNIHEKHGPNLIDYDIGLLKLTQDLVFNDTTAPAALPKPGDTYPIGTICTATGWGMVKEGQFISPHLQKVDLPLMSGELCTQYYPTHIKDFMFCAGYPEGNKDTCQGDSGGPLSVNGTVIGITSWGKGCAVAENPGVYTNVTYFLDYIDSVIKQ